MDTLNYLGDLVALELRVRLRESVRINERIAFGERIQHLALSLAKRLFDVGAETLERGPAVIEPDIWIAHIIKVQAIHLIMFEDVNPYRVQVLFHRGVCKGKIEPL